MHDGSKAALERAFELARSGRFTSVAELKRALRNEGYWADQISGSVLSAQLKDLIAKSKPVNDPAASSGVPVSERDSLNS
jgi:hypothetical protein